MTDGRGRTTALPMGATKRMIALAAVAAALLVLAVVFGILNLAVQEPGTDADPEAAFSPTEVVPRALAGRVTWTDDDPGLARDVEPTTRQQLTATWLRAQDALQRAASGDPDGLHVWLIGPALDQARARLDGPPVLPGSAEIVEVAVPRPVAHELTVRFYSLDGQVAVISATMTSERTAGGGQVTATTDRMQATIVLADGNWRVRNLARLGGA